MSLRKPIYHENDIEAVKSVYRIEDMEEIIEIATNKNGKFSNIKQKAAIHRLTDKEILAQLARYADYSDIKFEAREQLLTVLCGEYEDLFPEYKQETIEEIVGRTVRPVRTAEEVKKLDNDVDAEYAAGILSGCFGF